MKRFLKKSIVAMMIVALMFCSVELTDLGTGLTLTAKAATAESGQCGKNLTWNFKDGTLTITGSGEMKNYDNIACPSPFRGATDITSIVISEGVTSIGRKAFYECRSLESIELPDGLISIGESAFDGCGNLTSIELPEEVTSIEHFAFANCSSLTSIKLPDGVTELLTGAFCACSSLESINIPEGIREIKCATFASCSSLTSIELPVGVKSIEWNAFKACNSLKSVVIPVSVMSIDHPFAECENLVIYGGSGSCAEKYAKEYNIPFFSVCRHTASSHECHDATKETCTSNGYTVGIYCTKCNAWIFGHKVVKATGHKSTTTTTKATTSKNGSIVTKCSVCGNVSSKTTIYRPKTVTLSATSYTYNGKAKAPKITVKDSNGKTISASNYTVTYSNNKNVGKATVTIKFRENYSGTITKTFKINPVTTSISKLTAKSKGFTAEWTKKTTQITGYQLQYATSSSFSKAKTVTISKNSTTSKTISSLTKNKKYYVRIRTYKTVNGTKYYSSWSSKKSIKTK